MIKKITAGFLLLAFMMMGVITPVFANNIEQSDSVINGDVGMSAIAADNSCNGQISTPYEYPVQPGTKQWAAFTTLAEKINACNIPEDTLENMSTDALVETVLSYPLLPCILAFDSYEDGFNSVLNYSSGLKELVHRKDAGPKILEKYNSLKDSCQHLELAYTEIILSQPVIMDSLSKKQKNDLIKEATTRYKEKGYSYLLNSIQQNDYETRDYVTYVKTPEGTPVRVIRQEYDYSPDTIDKANKRMDAIFPNADRLRSATRYYNCHSYAWYSTKSTNKYWMNNPEAYMTDGSYTSGTAKAGRKVFYDNDNDNDVSGNHSGIVYSVSGHTIMVTSKWGEYGLYRHNIYDSPYSGDKTDYSYWH